MQTDSDSWVDPALAPFAVLVETLSVPAELEESESGEETMWLQRIGIDLPFEMDVLVGDEGTVRLAGGPPTQYTETTVMPVFHRLRLTVVTEKSDG